MPKHLSGVYIAKRKDGSFYYRSSITFRSKHISLGSYDSPDAAHEAYLLASHILSDCSCTVAEYEHGCILPFEKWITLLNFRDNGIYFATPIYIRPKFFYYYFSPSVFFTFDTEDLFFYSSHKISCRGGHYFVADYGMQINIMNRYGIKNYAVEGKDYRFINGDNRDFRYENLEIFNRYQGVEQVKVNGTIRYRVKIHVKGNYTVGTYDTEREAAVAYNKAADILKKAGVNKDYALNYLEGMSPAAYAELYASIKVSPKLYRYRSE